MAYEKKHWIKTAAAAIVLAAVTLPALAQVSPEDEYTKLIHVDSKISPAGEHPFGAQVSLYDGALSFRHTDVSLPGNGPLLRLVRSFSTKGNERLGEIGDSAFADWELEIPRITTMTAQQMNAQGWVVTDAESTARCSNFAPPPTVAMRIGMGGADWEPYSWWYGYTLVVPGHGSQPLLDRHPDNMLAPADGQTYPIVTKAHWMIRCLPTIDNDVGEGFLALAPDGTRYWFNHLVYRWAPTLSRPLDSGPMMVVAAATVDLLHRRKASMLVTRIEDRFGNSLTYSYDGANLTAITASDGREVELHYADSTYPSRVTSVTAQPASSAPRTWTYHYDGSNVYGALTSVTLPDGRAWTYDLSDLVRAHADLSGTGKCPQSASVGAVSYVGSLTRPSGCLRAAGPRPMASPNTHRSRSSTTPSSSPARRSAERAIPAPPGPSTTRRPTPALPASAPARRAPPRSGPNAPIRTATPRATPSATVSTPPRASC
ncbi:MAG TPA: hypothetical protein VFG73_07305 [Rhodanobacteraceae bacterium]|nr:hypothetical protein [Rhodanobacteraceae bacterium]